MSDLPPIPDPLECVLFDAGDTLLAPSPSFHGRFVQVAARHGFELEEAAAVADRLDRSGHATVVLAGVLPARAGRARPSGGRGGARRGAVPLLQRPRGLQAVPRRAARAGRPGRPGRQAGGGVQLRAVAGGRARPGGRRPAVRGGGDLRQARGRQAGAGHLPGRPGAGRRRRRDDRARRRPARQRRGGGAGGRHHAGAAGPLRPRPRRRRAPGPEHDRAGRPARRGGLTGMDRSFWRVIANDENALPQGEWVAELTPELLGWLGSTDPELRDEFAYRILAAWIERGQYGADQLRTIAKQMTANLEAGLGEDGTDSVFLRTYSVLILMEVVASDNVSPFLDPADLDGFLEAALGYLRRERDLRSWVPGPGWANAVGHTADLLMMLARSPHLGAAELQRILDAIAERLLAPYFQTMLTESPPPDARETLECIVGALRRADIGFFDLA